MMVSLARGRFAGTILALAVVALLPMRSASASMLTIVAPTPVLMPGQSETISVLFSSTQAFTLGAADIEIAYDSTRFTATNGMGGSLNPSATFSNFINTNQPGYVLASISSGTGTPISVGTSGTLETFTLTALANAPVGGATGDINLLAQSPFGLQPVTAVYDLPGNSITLTPAPSDGLDANDGTVMVAGAVPEPSSIILMGLGSGLIAAAARYRKKARRASALAA